MPRYQPADPVLRRATTHSIVPFGVVVGYAPCDSNAAPYAPSGGTSNGAGASATVGAALDDAVAERSALTMASSSGDATNAMSTRIPIKPASTTGLTRMRPMSRSDADPARSGIDSTAGNTAPTLAMMVGKAAPIGAVSFFAGSATRAEAGRDRDAVLRSEGRGARAVAAALPNERTGAATRDAIAVTRVAIAVTRAASALTRAASAVTRAASDVNGDVSRPRGMRARAAATSSSSPASRTTSRISETTPCASPDSSDRTAASGLDTVPSVSGSVDAADAR